MSHFRADLHCHTTCSDGALTPSEIIEAACNRGLQGLSITDHDTIAAYTEALPIAQDRQLPLLSGVEFSSIYRQTMVHVLGYSFALSSPAIQEFCQRHHQRRHMRHQKILELLAHHGMPLTPEDFPDSLMTTNSKTSLGRPHIAQAMVKKKYVPTIQHAFHEYLGEGKCCHVRGEFSPLEETLEVIHQAGGLAILAHPHLIEKVGILKELLSMKFDGLEGYYGSFSHSQQERWIKIAKQRNWIVTGGSDFHGTHHSYSFLGSSWVNAETFDMLYQLFQRNQL